MSSAPPAPSQSVSPRRRVRWLWLPIALLALLGAVYVAGQVALGLKDIPRGTSVAGVDVGGKSLAEAARLIEANAAQIRRPLALTVGGQALQLSPASAGLGIDAAASARAAAGRPWAPWSMVSALRGHRDLPPVIAVDATKLSAAVEDIAHSLQSTFREGAIVFQGVTPTAVEPQPGKQLDTADAIAKIRSAYLVSDTPIELVLTEQIPTVTADEVQRALTKVAQPAVAAPITVTAGPKSVTISPAALAAALTFRAVDGHLQYFLDGTALTQSVTGELAALEVKPKDAAIIFKNGKPAVVPAIVGHVATPEGVSSAVMSVLTDPAPRSAPLVLGDIQPKLTTAAANALGVREVVGQFTTHHPCCAPRVQNIHAMADIVSGTVIMPGATFDLNGIVGERDVARGFVSAPMILGGLFVESVGGGVSQFATTTFNAAFFAGFSIVQHQTHSYYISRYPAGREATVSWPEPDLKWLNDSRYGALITTSYTDTSVTVTIWSTKRYDIASVSSDPYRPTTALPAKVYNPKPGCEGASGEGGFDIDVWRVFSSGGKEIKREQFHTRYVPEPVIICGPQPVTKTPTPTPSGTKTPPPVSGTPKPTSLTPKAAPSVTPTATVAR